ncbi:DUF4329 domain-containing protein [Asticcacaulis sp. W401b]|uniref:DUF4329 domain-containing protein n=1 Tax=Asticcacaulis sp. W401b TaxID=3388666 RepID=UPI003970EEAE
MGRADRAPPSKPPSTPLNLATYNLGAEFATPEQAILDALKKIQGDSLSLNKEIGGVIKYNPDTGGYYVSTLSLGGKDYVTQTWRGDIVATFHTHAAYETAQGVVTTDPNLDNTNADNWSRQDIDSAEDRNVPSIMLRPDGRAASYDPRTDTYSELWNIHEQAAPQPTAPAPGGQP